MSDLISTLPKRGRLGHVARHTLIGRCEGIKRVVKWPLEIGATGEHAHFVGEDDRRAHFPDPFWDPLRVNLPFSLGVRLEVHVFSSLCKYRGEAAEHSHAHPAIEQFLQPEDISEVPPLSIEIDSKLRDDSPTNEQRAGQYREAVPYVTFEGNQ